jgi:hypothetical protein
MIPVEDVNITRLIAKCRSCQAVFAFEAQTASSKAAVASVERARETSLEVPLPAGFEVHRDPAAPNASTDYRTAATDRGRLRIVRRWFGPQHIVLLLFSLVWSAIVFKVAAALVSGLGLVGLLLSSVHGIVGLVLAYGAVSGFVNRTEILVERGALSVRHGPIPTRGNRDIPADEVRQLFTIEHRGNKGARVYELQALVSRGAAVTIAKGLLDPRQALFLERVLEEHLGIADQPVPGELPK